MSIKKREFIFYEFCTHILATPKFE